MPERDCRAQFFRKHYFMAIDDADATDGHRFNTRIRRQFTVHRSWLAIRHAELVSASHREPLLLLLRGQILKFAVKREQRKACLNFAEREQIERNQIQDDHQLCSVVFCYIVEYCCPVKLKTA